MRYQSEYAQNKSNGMISPYPSVAGNMTQTILKHIFISRLAYSQQSMAMTMTRFILKHAPMLMSQNLTSMPWAACCLL